MRQLRTSPALSSGPESAIGDSSSRHGSARMAGGSSTVAGSRPAKTRSTMPSPSWAPFKAPSAKPLPPTGSSDRFGAPGSPNTNGRRQLDASRNHSAAFRSPTHSAYSKWCSPRHCASSTGQRWPGMTGSSRQVIARKPAHATQQGQRDGSRPALRIGQRLVLRQSLATDAQARRRRPDRACAGSVSAAPASRCLSMSVGRSFQEGVRAFSEDGRASVVHRKQHAQAVVAGPVDQRVRNSTRGEPLVKRTRVITRVDDSGRTASTPVGAEFARANAAGVRSRSRLPARRD